MALDADKLKKPFRSLEKSLKKLSKRPSPKEVHNLRTRTRRVEATLHALLLDQKRDGRKALKAISPVRKRAGKVRDMDVLIGLVSSLGSTSADDCRIRIIENLSKLRRSGVRKLRRVTAKSLTSATQRLKRCSTEIKRNHSDKKGQRQWAADAAAITLQLSQEIRDWPELNAKNLHPFRLKVKELRYVLQLSGSKDDLVETLGKVKDKIGDWHNWVALSTIAKGNLDQSGPCAVLEQISSRERKSLLESIHAANRMRIQYFHPRPKRTRSRVRAASPSQSVLKAAAKLAA